MALNAHIAAHFAIYLLTKDSPLIPVALNSPVPPLSPSPARKHIVLAEEVTKKDSGLDLHPFHSKIPKFYFPFGTPTNSHARICAELTDIFGSNSLAEHEFGRVTAACGLPKYINAALFRRAANNAPAINLSAFVAFWQSIAAAYHSTEAIIFAILKQPNASHITPSDIQIAVHDVTLHHPGLQFLASYPNFQARYTETVVARLFYAKPSNWNFKMTYPQFVKSKFVDSLKQLEVVDDINWTHDIFSYQHFYVIYCKFWELDRDHDLFIDLFALKRYDNGAMTDAILRRVIAGYGKRPSILSAKSASASNSSNLAADSTLNPSTETLIDSPSKDAPKDTLSEESTFKQSADNKLSRLPLKKHSDDPAPMSYEDFIWFILSVEEKQSPYAIEYWFRCLDLDGDGVISLYELHHFFREQYERMFRSRMSDLWKFDDFICSLIDLIKPAIPNRITLSDLKKSKSAPLFFDMLFDLRKYDAFIRRIDPSFRDQDDQFYNTPSGERVRLEGFQKFASKAYSVLAEEECQANASMSNLGLDHHGMDDVIHDDMSHDLDDMEDAIPLDASYLPNPSDWDDDDDVIGHHGATEPTIITVPSQSPLSSSIGTSIIGTNRSSSPSQDVEMITDAPHETPDTVQPASSPLSSNETKNDNQNTPATANSDAPTLEAKAAPDSHDMMAEDRVQSRVE